MKINKLKKIPEFLRKISIKSALFSYPRYQPVYFEKKNIDGADRNCLNRWQIIKKELISNDVKNILDIGSAEGFFVLKSADELGLFSIGIDFDSRRQFFAVNQMLNQKPSGAGFVMNEINPKSIEKLSNFDAIIFLSVMHHIINENGLEYGRKIMEKIKNKTNKVLFFEMGTSEEKENAWAKNLPDMGENPEIWIKNFLLSSGFKEVIKIGDNESYQSKIKRPLFKALP